MFTELVRKETATIRGAQFTFHEIGSVEWVNHVMTDEAPGAERSQVEIAQSNHDYAVRVVAASIEPGVDKTFKDLASELHPMPGALVDELFEVAERVNDLAAKFEKLQGKVPPAVDTPAD